LVSGFPWLRDTAENAGRLCETAHRQYGSRLDHNSGMHVLCDFALPLVVTRAHARF
jgi:hypothetical protein